MIGVLESPIRVTPVKLLVTILRNDECPGTFLISRVQSGI
jgi:hypothetical protein